jgi:hypothetical protein
VDPDERLMQPFYLKMMGLNALENADELWDGLLRAGESASLAEVTTLLGQGHWRPVVMGAWFSLKFDRELIGDDLKRAVNMCQGSLTAPPLAVAAAVVIGSDAASTLIDYINRGQLGSESFVAAVVADLGRDAPIAFDERDRRAVTGMSDVAHRLRASWTDA